MEVLYKLRFRNFFLAGFLLFFSACMPPQDSLVISSLEVRGASEGGSVHFIIQSNQQWQMSELPPYLECYPTTGRGYTEVTAIFQTNPLHKKRHATITVATFDFSALLTFEQAPTTNNSPPSVPRLLSPSENHVSTAVFPTFRWEASTDENEDALSYTLLYSQDQENWTSLACGKETTTFLHTPLLGETQYYWKIVVEDGYSGVSESHIATFTTGVTNYRNEGEVRTLQENRLENGVNLVFLCDGFIAEDLVINGAYDQLAERASEYFFEIEPYNTYRDYFNAYLVYSYSNDRGISYGAQNTVKNTSFNLSCNKDSRTSTHMTCNQSRVLSYASKAPIGPFSETLVIVIANDARYAGTCWMWTNGQAIALLTAKEDNYPYNFKGVLHHEAGGHGFGKLADEYTSTSAGRSRSDIPTHHAYGAYTNVDITNDLETIYWKHFINKKSYEKVGAYEGAYYFTTGVWRAEEGSCMVNNINYYSAPSREAIVKRIKFLANEAYSFEEFLANDVTTKPKYMLAPPTRLQEYLYLHPPVWVE